MPKVPNTPQEKKSLSLKKDRRNTYGENSKSSRKNIPLSKANSLRQVRRVANQLTENLECMDETTADLIESTLSKSSLQKGVWRKSPDEPLSVVLERKGIPRKASSKP